MKTKEIIKQLESLKLNQEDFIPGDDTGIFKKDCEALEAAVNIIKNRFKEDKVLTILSIIDLKIEELEKRCSYDWMQEKENEEQLYYLLIRKQELKSLLDDIKEVLKHDSSI